MCVKDNYNFAFLSTPFFSPFLTISGQPNTTTHKLSQFRKKNNNNNSKESKNFIMFRKNKIYWAVAKSFANGSDGIVLEVLNPFDGVTYKCMQGSSIQCPAPASTAHKPCLSGGSTTSSSRSILPLLV